MILLDTSFIVGYKIANDVHHENAVKLINDIADGKYGTPIISDYVFDETVTVIFGRSRKLSFAIETGNDLRESVQIITIGELVFEDAWKIFKSQSKNFSFTDCTTLAIMKKKGIRNIATFDKDFKDLEGIDVIGA